MPLIHPRGTQEVTVSTSEFIQIAAPEGKAIISYVYGSVAQQGRESKVAEIEFETVTLGAMTENTIVRIEAGAGIVFYDTGSAPVARRDTLIQGAPAAKTVSATLTAAEVLTGIITVNQAAAGASALQLPLATAMDTALPGFSTNESFDFSVINTSTVDAEDATITTNTGWTLVGDIAIPAKSAAGSLNTSALFRARKTAAGAWTLYRLA